ncbi:hypothetical protein Ddc_20514 [Ditylenchus destructor]|nr:hypothetical protein Ddc_20514 [Ditylenchus destructor]
MNTTSSSPAYLPYLNFTEHVGFLIAGSFAIFCNFRLLYHGLLKRQSQAISMSRSIYVLIFSHTALLFASLPYAMFMVWKKTDDLNELSAYAMYWTGLPANCYMVSSSIPIFFLTLDRCLSVKLSVRYNDSNRNRMFVTSIVVISVACAAGAVIALMELPWRMRQLTLSPGKVQIGDKGHIGHKNDMHNFESYTELLFFQITSSTTEF